MGEYRIVEKSLCSDPLQSQLACALRADPNHSELGFLLTHLHIEDLARPNLSPYSLKHQPTSTHVRHQGGIRKWLAVSIHPPNLHRKLDFNSWALASIHRGHCAVRMIDRKLTRVTANRVPECGVV